LTKRAATPPGRARRDRGVRNADPTPAIAVQFDAAVFAQAFPFHVMLDGERRLCQLGTALQRLLPDCKPGDPFESHFAVNDPDRLRVPAAPGRDPLTIAYRGVPALELIGHVVPLAGTDAAVLLCRPRLDALDALPRLAETGLSVRDLPTDDAGGDLIRLVELQQAALDEAGIINERLREARDAAMQAAQVKTQFLANLSHELRTPLNAILGFSEALGGEIFGPIPARYRAYLGDIHASGRMLQDLIDDLLDLSRIEAGRHDLDEAPAALVGLLRECLRLVSREARRKDVRVEFGSRRFQPVVVLADARALKQVFLNILSNAVKFSDPRGVVTVLLRASRTGDVEIVIIDNGIGIPAEIVPELFEPFRQADIIISRKYGGTGLGLGICRRLMELHGGSIDLESTPGVGTKVFIRLPAERVLDVGKDDADEGPGEPDA
jgi:signal transduction histidine kinase